MTRFLVWQRLFLLLAAGLFLCGFDLSPKNWVRDIGKMWERNTPSVKDVMFWDFEQNQMRGIRALFYTVAKERENRMVDLRLHQKMTQFLSSICREVITLDSFEESNQKRMVEQVLVQLLDQWKLRGEVDPATLFKPFPMLQTDILVLMERIYYDQVWKNNQKHLAIGVHAAAFEMDFGKPIFQERMIVEAPWSGESISHLKAEHAALLKVADSLGEKLQAMANEINRAHLELEQQRLEEQKKQEAARIAQLDAETQQYVQLVIQAQAILDKKSASPEQLETLHNDVEALKPLLVTSSGKTALRDNFRSPFYKQETKTLQSLTKEDIDTRNQLAASIQSQLEAIKTWEAEQEEKRKQEAIASQPVLKQPGVQIPGASPVARPSTVPLNAPPQESWVGIPSIQYPKGQLFERRWLLPSMRAVQAEPLPILPQGQSLQPEIQSTPLRDNLPEMFRQLTPSDLPPLPSSASGSQAAGTPDSATP